jgi:hypothetical protein
MPRFASELVRHPLETTRLAPYGTGLASLLGSMAIITGSKAFDAPTPFTQALLTGLAIGSSVAAPMEGVLIERQLHLRDRLEHNIETHGYSDRLMAPTTDEWCARQTARVVSENHGMLEQYKALCEQRSETARLLWLPHI